MIKILTPDNANMFSDLHKECFEDCWSTQSFKDLLNVGSQGLGFYQGNSLQSLIVYQWVLDEGEILTFCTRKDQRSKGYGKILMEEVLKTLLGSGIKRILLEVAEDNSIALRFYSQYGFGIIGARPKYYKKIGGPSRNALVMELKNMHISNT